MVSQMFFVFVFAFVTSIVSMTRIHEQEPSANDLPHIHMTSSAVLPNSKNMEGSTTNIELYPYAGTLQLRKGLQLVCGCIIINRRSLLTAASCIEKGANPKDFRVRVGSTRRSHGGIVRSVAHFIINPTFNPGNLDGDVAIIKVKTPMHLGSAKMQAATLPPPDTHIPDDCKVTAVGWGSVIINPVYPILLESLRIVELRTANQASCRHGYEIFGSTVTDSMMCARGNVPRPPSGSCRSDGGSALVYNKVVVGISSFVIRDCVRFSLPSVYTRVSQYVEWIRCHA